MTLAYPTLSLRQPWAWLVVHGGKRVENRVWDTRYRGRFFIHTSAKTTRREYDATEEFCADLARDGQGWPTLPPFEDLVLGAIVGVATLADVLPPLEYPDRPWHMAGQYGFVLTDVRPVPPLQCWGRQRWWDAQPLRQNWPDWGGWSVWAA